MALWNQTAIQFGHDDTLMINDERDRLLEKLRGIEALYTGGATAGERSAAEAALQRVQARLRTLGPTDPPIEFRFSLNNSWSRRLFVAILRRYGIRPYRYRGQRYTTVMARVPKSFVDSTLWPEFDALDKALQQHIDAITESIIKEAFSADTSEAEEVRGTDGSGPQRALGAP